MRDSSRASRPTPASRSNSWLETFSSALLALLLALVVWVVSVYDKDPPRLDYFDGIPIKYVNVPQGLVIVGNVDDRVRVQVRAPQSHWSALTPDTIDATVDLQGLDAGVHNVDVQVHTVDKSAMVVQRTPARVVVRLEQQLTRAMPVRTVIGDSDSLPPGYAAQPPVVSPPTVTVTGPRSVVESVSEVDATIWLRGSKTSVQSNVAPVAHDAEGNVVNGIDLSPATVGIDLNVQPLAEFRDATVRAVLKGTPAAGYWVSNITVDPATVTIQGKPEIIRSMPSVVSTEPIDISGVKESLSKRVDLILPTGTSIYSADTNGQSVTVRVEVTPIVGGKIVQPRVEVQGLKSGLAAVASPDTVDVILSGPVPELQALQLADVKVVVNLFGLGVGQHKVTPQVILPDGTNLKVENMVPDSVDVTISSTTTRGGS